MAYGPVLSVTIGETDARHLKTMGRKRIREAAQYIADLKAAGYTVIDYGDDVVAIEREGRRVGTLDLVNNLRIIGGSEELLQVLQPKRRA